MTYFRINLNKLEDPSIAKARERREQLLYAVFALFFLVLLCAALSWNSRLNGRIKLFKHDRTELTERIRQLETDRNFISEKDVRSLDGLDSRRLLWTGKLEALSRACSEAVAVTEMRFSRGNLFLKGVARADKSGNNFERVSGFIDRLKKEPALTGDFTRIEFRASSRFDFLDQTLLGFEVVCYPK